MNSKKIEVAKKALLYGSVHVLSLFGKSIQELGTEYKPEAGDTPRTLIDRYSENAIISYIRQDAEFSGDLVNAEESGISGSGKRVWYIDPYDGTSNAQIKLPMSTMGIGISEDDELVASVILNPFERKLFYAERGKGAFVVKLVKNSDGTLEETDLEERLKTDTSSRSFKDRYAWIDSNFSQRPIQRKLEWISGMQRAGFFMNVRSSGSNIDYSAKIAEGRGHFQLTDTIGGFYDLCGCCLVEEAGGKMFNIYGERPTPKDYVAVAIANPKDFDKVLGITRNCYKGYKGFTDNNPIFQPIPLERREKSLRYRFFGIPKDANEFLDMIRKNGIEKIDVGMGCCFDDFGVGIMGTYTCYPVLRAGGKTFKMKKGRRGPFVCPNDRTLILDLEEASFKEIVQISRELQSKGLLVTIANMDIDFAIEKSNEYRLTQRQKLSLVKA